MTNHKNLNRLVGIATLTAPITHDDSDFLYPAGQTVYIIGANPDALGEVWVITTLAVSGDGVFCGTLVNVKVSDIRASGTTEAVNLRASVGASLFNRITSTIDNLDNLNA